MISRTFPASLIMGMLLMSPSAFSDPLTPANPNSFLSPSACEPTEEGFDAFFEFILYNPQARVVHSASPLSERSYKDPSQVINRPAGPFRLAMADFFWVYADPAKDVSQWDRVKLDFKLQGKQMRVNFVKVEISPEEEVVRTIGKPEAYIFEHTGQCWKLIQHLQ